MAWDPAISRKINVPFEAGDVEEFTRLLRIHPEYLRHPDGSDLWMWSAAMNGRLSIIESLVDLGLDVNTPKDQQDGDDPFYTPEGAILQAATEGHLDIVRWLLDHGAKINYVVQGNPRCLPLLQAAAKGHLDVVKILVEYGADIHSSWNGLNAVQLAKDYGHSDVLNYLLSLP